MSNCSVRVLVFVGILLFLSPSNLFESLALVYFLLGVGKKVRRLEVFEDGTRRVVRIAGR